MAGLSLGESSEFSMVKGAIWWFAGVVAPAAGTPITLALDPTGTFMTPDATTNPNGFSLGCTNDGWKVATEYQTFEEFCDESTVAEFSGIESSSTTLEGNIRNPLAEKIMVNLFGLIKDGTPADTWDIYSGGSDPALKQLALCGVFKNPKNAAQYGYILYPKAQLITGFNLDQITRKKSASTLVRFKILGDSARGVGKEAFDIGKQKVTT